MGLTTFPAAGGGGIKLVQRGQATSSGNITITSVDTSKSFLRSFSEGASGTVTSDSSSTGTLTASGGDIAGSGNTNTGSSSSNNNGGSFATYSGTRTFSGGTMNATTKQFGVYFVNSTTITATGACRWEVVEFN